MDWISDPTAWSALTTLLTLEIVLGVDNVVFISILASKLPVEDQDRARRTGLLAAGGVRVFLPLGVGWIITLKKKLFAIDSVGFSGKEMILFAGGLFLIQKASINHWAVVCGVRFAPITDSEPPRGAGLSPARSQRRRPRPRSPRAVEAP